MAKKNFSSQNNAKISLGKLISKLRKDKNITLRQLAGKIGLSPSNLSYIEHGTNVPTAEIYQKLIEELSPDNKMHKKLDCLYSTIRNAPPPDICEVLMQNPALGEKIRLLAHIQLSLQQVERIEDVFMSFKK